jgi:hypothetical protein
VVLHIALGQFQQHSMTEPPKSAGQFVENIVVEGNAFSGAAAFDIFDEVSHGIIRAAD